MNYVGLDRSQSSIGLETENHGMTVLFFAFKSRLAGILANSLLYLEDGDYRAWVGGLRVLCQVDF